MLFNRQANAVQYRLIVRQVKTLQITRLYTCLDAVQHVEVKLKLCAMHTQRQYFLLQSW